MLIFLSEEVSMVKSPNFENCLFPDRIVKIRMDREEYVHELPIIG